MRSIVPRFVAAALLLAACGDDRPDQPDAATGWTAESVCAALSAAICRGLTDCACRFDQRPYDAATCTVARTEACRASVEGQAGADLAAGRVRFDDAGITACLAELGTLVASCDLAHDDGPLPAACSGIFVAAADLGEVCPVAGLALCAGGAGVCTRAEDDTWPCTARPGAGAPCVSGVCAVGLTCHEVVDGDPRCDTPGAPGAPCLVDGACAAGTICTPGGTCAAPGGDGVACADALDCAEGLTCVVDRCAPAPALGDPCSSPPACGAGRSCGRAPETRTCELPGEPGAPCAAGTCAAGLGCAEATATCVTLPGAGSECLDGAGCAPGTTCDFTTTTCVTPPGAGEPCLDSADRRCADGLGCRESDLRCQPASVATAGQPCMLNGPEYVCAAGLGCDFTPQGSICAARSGPGTPCNTSRTCSADSYCAGETQTCAPRVADGEDCPAGDECRPGSTCTLGAGGWTCAPIPQAGEPCLWDCAPGLACQGPGGVCVPELCVIP